MAANLTCLNFASEPGAPRKRSSPGSVHPSGEVITWEERRPPVRIAGDELKRGLAQTAAASVLAHLYPQQGGRHDAAVIIGGFLARAGYVAPQAKPFVEVVAVASCQPLDKRRDMIRAAESGVNDFAAGKPVAGFPKLAEVFGEKAAKAVADWLGYEGELDPEELPASGTRKPRKKRAEVPLEDALALDFAGRHCDELRVVSFWGKWLKWTGEKWQVEKTLAAFDLARKICHGHSLGGLRARTGRRRRIAGAF
jgi:hypothetical protein